MQEIRDLSDLMTLLAARPTGALAVEIHPDVHASLAACLQLGLRNLADVPTALPPRLTVEINATKYSSPVIVYPKDFFGYLRTGEENLQLISVDQEKLSHGLAWVEDHSRSDRFSAIHRSLSALCRRDAKDQRVDAPYAHVQEIVDWLDLIMDRRPNALAEELRTDVLDHNSIALQPQIDARPPLYRY